MRSLLLFGSLSAIALVAPTGCAGTAEPTGVAGTTANGAAGGMGGNAGAVAGAASTAGTMSAGGMSAGVAGTAGANIAGSGVAGAGMAGAGVAGAGTAGAGIDPGCDYIPLMVMDCAHAGCHAPSPVAAAGLDLTPTAGLIGRLKDVRARHMNINCAPAGEPIVECGFVPATCPSDVLLVSSANWEASWMIAKLRGTAVGCGDIMRDPTYLTEKPDREACVEAVVKAIAEAPP
jgi:hypothetical protein